MIKVTDVTKSYGGQVLFKDLSFNINSREKIGLVGRNGYGKTTLFNLLLGKTEPDEGSISIPNDYRIGHLEQHIRFTQDTVLKEGCLGLPEGDRDSSWKVEKILFGLGFNKDDMSRPPSAFSGGYQIRLNLAKVLVSEPNILLLDEPNNYLDIVAIRWLIGFLRAWKGELMLITHDRNFMDSVTTHTMVLHRRKVRKVEGDTDKLYSQIAQEEEIYEKTRLNEEKKRKQTESFIRRFRAKARLAGMVQSRIKCLEKQERMDQLEKIDDLEFTFNAAPFNAATMLSMHNVSFSYTGGETRLIDKFSISIGRRDRIGIIGKNGKGKSTLLRLLAGELAPLEGHIKTHTNLRTGHFCQTNVARLNDLRTIFEEIMSADPECLPQHARDIAGGMMFAGDAALKKIGVLSGGEKNRVMLGKLLVTPCNLLLLDEPTNHLDMESCDSLLEAIDRFDGSVAMVTHNELFLQQLATRLVIFDKGTVTLFEGSYQDFLESVGWEDEAEEKVSLAQQVPEKKLVKKMKADLLRERSQALRPFETEIAALEKKITALELDLHRSTELLVKASTEGDAPAIAELSKKTYALRPQIEELYERLDRVTGEYEEKGREYKARMDALDN